MQVIPLNAIPNQSLVVQLDGNSYTLVIKETNDVICVDIFINDVIIELGARIVSGFPLIPYHYLENGNFTFLTEDEEYPHWTQFGISQTLIYATQAELEVLRDGT